MKFLILALFVKNILGLTYKFNNQFGCIQAELKEIVLTSELKSLKKCLGKCVVFTRCKFATFIQNECNLYTKYVNMSYSSDYKIYERVDGIYDPDFHWPIYKSDVKELVTRGDLYNPVNAAFAPNRFSEVDSAIRLTYGIYSLPLRDYFTSDFSFMAWIKINSLSTNGERLVECGSSLYDSIVFSVSNSNLNTPFMQMVNVQRYVYGSMKLEVNIWSHLTFILKGDIGYIYINGTLDAKDKLAFTTNVNRTVCLLGGSLWENPSLNADLDDLKIFKRVLNENEIKNELSRL
ncbi:unnamed protein product [Brachionus calyciflorus]|uniref:Apple domain-containing protein n=1 Tax=Brachionus calyciflorus TaxID=104777 RepID=A0A814P7T1_9BILA|nr:unnamed protein product [Brachionus calyciflorus]